jgi:uncharacterized membrane protein
VASDADLRMELAISRVLRVGVTMAGVIVLIGSVLYLSQAHGVLPDYRHFHGVASPVDRITPVIDGIRHRDGRSIIRLGILLLIATPILRVAYCVFGFAAQKDKLYVLISGTVLAVLLYSLFRQ